MSEAKRYRVIQWATGNVGARTLASIIEHSRLELVGLLVHSEDKRGKDAGELCGLGRTTGIKATCSVDEIVAMDADVVCYMPVCTNFEHVCRLLASGKNIVTGRNELGHPLSIDPEERERVEAACKQGGTSVHASGSSPGFITEALAIPLMAQQRRFDGIIINEYADMSTRDSHNMIFNMMGFGAAPGKVNQGMLHAIKTSVSGSILVLAQALGVPLDVMTTGEQAVARSDKTVAAGTVKAGTVAAMRLTTSGVYEGKTLFSVRSHWFLSSDVDEKEEWGIKDNVAGWLVNVKGDTPMDVRVTYPVEPEDYAAYSPGLTAHRIVNAIPAVCEAAPGIRTILDIKQVLPAL
ncbi:unnamed protein product [Discula destructiva]